MFAELPLEMKLYVVELDPLNLGNLILADRELYEYHQTEEGKNWYTRILQIRIVDTDKEKGMIILNNLKHGEWKYYQNGKLIKSTWYEIGLKDGLEYTYYPKVGQVESIIPYIRDVITGTVKVYYINGDLKTELDYVENVMHGKCITWYKNNKISSTSTYNNGLLEGEYIAYYPNGNIKEQTYYKDGTVDGSYISYTPRGRVASKLDYILGRLTHAQYFDKNGLRDIVYDGHKRIEKIFEYGKLVKSTEYPHLLNINKQVKI